MRETRWWSERGNSPREIREKAVLGENRLKGLLTNRRLDSGLQVEWRGEGKERCSGISKWKLMKINVRK